MILFLKYLYNYNVYAWARFRAICWGILLKRIGKEVYIREKCIILNPSGVQIGNHVFINRYTELDGHATLKIGNYVQIGPFCNIITANHGFKRADKPMFFQDIESKPVVIEDDVWIGAHVVILPGVTIHHGSIVGAGAVVSHDVKANTIVGGVPAKFIKNRFLK
jgi:acetyltransferase-like isoleucine patch superfamily enzyme